MPTTNRLHSECAAPRRCRCVRSASACWLACFRVGSHRPQRALCYARASVQTCVGGERLQRDSGCMNTSVKECERASEYVHMTDSITMCVCACATEQSRHPVRSQRHHELVQEGAPVRYVALSVCVCDRSRETKSRRLTTCRYSC